MKKVILLLGLVFSFSLASQSGDISRVEDFKEIDGVGYCAGVSFVKNVDDGSEDAGFIIYNLKNKDLFSMTMVNDQTNYFSSTINSCIPNNESIFLLQSSETSPVEDSQLKLTLHKFSQTSKNITLSKEFLAENTRVYPCSADIKDGNIIVEVIADESKTTSLLHTGPFVKKVLSFNDNLDFVEISSKEVSNDEIFKCYKSKANFFQSMFKNLSVDTDLSSW